MAQAKPEIRKIVGRYIIKLRDIGVPVERVYLFGSQLNVNPNTESDVDIAVISPLFEKMSLWDMAGYLGKAAMDMPYPIDALGFSPSQVKEAAPGTLLSHILRNGLQIT